MPNSRSARYPDPLSLAPAVLIALCCLARSRHVREAPPLPMAEFDTLKAAANALSAVNRTLIAFHHALGRSAANDGATTASLGELLTRVDAVHRAVGDIVSANLTSCEEGDARGFRHRPGPGGPWLDMSAMADAALVRLRRPDGSGRAVGDGQSLRRRRGTSTTSVTSACDRACLKFALRYRYATVLLAGQTRAMTVRGSRRVFVMVMLTPAAIALASEANYPTPDILLDAGGGVHVVERRLPPLGVVFAQFLAVGRHRRADCSAGSAPQRVGPNPAGDRQRRASEPPPPTQGAALPATLQTTIACATPAQFQPTAKGRHHRPQHARAPGRSRRGARCARRRPARRLGVSS